MTAPIDVGWDEGRWGERRGLRAGICCLPRAPDASDRLMLRWVCVITACLMIAAAKYPAPVQDVITEKD